MISRLALALALLATPAWADGLSAPIAIPQNAPGAAMSFPPQTAVGGGCSQATAFLGRVSTTYTTAYTTMICGMVTDGTWAHLDALWVLATDTSATALTNLVSSSYPLTNVSATFTANTGYASPATGDYLSTTYNFSTGTAFTQNDASMGVWTLETSCLALRALEDSAASNYEMVLPCFASSAYTWLNAGTAQGSIAISNFGAGLISFERQTGTANTITGYQNGSSGGTTASTSAAPGSATLRVLGQNGGFTANIGAVFIGGSLGSAGQASFYSRLHIFLNTVNATSYP